MLKSLGRLLRLTGLQEETFSSALQFLEQYDPGRPGCLVLDVSMDEMSGLDLQKELTNRGITLPIIMISGYADVPNVVAAVKEGAIDFLEKPFDDELLLHRVQQSIERRAGVRNGRNATDAHAPRNPCDGTVGRRAKNQADCLRFEYQPQDGRHSPRARAGENEGRFGRRPRAADSRSAGLSGDFSDVALAQEAAHNSWKFSAGRGSQLCAIQLCHAKISEGAIGVGVGDS